MTTLLLFLQFWTIAVFEARYFAVRYPPVGRFVRERLGASDRVGAWGDLTTWLSTLTQLDWIARAFGGVVDATLYLGITTLLLVLSVNISRHIVDAWRRYDLNGYIATLVAYFGWVVMTQGGAVLSEFCAASPWSATTFCLCGQTHFCLYDQAHDGFR